MYRICKSDRQPNNTIAGALPSPPAGENDPGYFSAGDPQGGVVPTHFSADWANRVQEEIVAPILAAGLTLSPTDNGQLLKALYKLAVRGMISVSDEKPSGTPGGTFTSGAWRTRSLNTLQQHPAGQADLSANQLTLPAGVWGVAGAVPGHQVGLHAARLWSITGGAKLIMGTSVDGTASSNDLTTPSFIVGVFTLAAPATLEVQHRCTTTKTSNGFGQPCSFGEPEVYTVCMFWRMG